MGEGSSKYERAIYVADAALLDVSPDMNDETTGNLTATAHDDANM